MTEIIRLQAHDPLPEGGRQVIVLHRFQEDGPRGTETQIILTGHPSQTTHPVHPNGKPMTLDEAVAAARQVAESEGINRVHVVDRTAGPREREVLAHGGDHSVNSDALEDTDPEDGERGTDMRDRGS